VNLTVTEQDPLTAIDEQLSPVFGN